MNKAGEVRLYRPDPDRLKYAFWQFYCAVFCDQQEKFVTREKAAEWYRKLNPPPSRVYLRAEVAEPEVKENAG